MSKEVLAKLSVDPLTCCCMLWASDEHKKTSGNLHRWARPAEEIADDIARCGFNAVIVSGIGGSNLKPEDIRSRRYRGLLDACHERGLLVGHGLPFADTRDNMLTRNDGRLHQLTREGKKSATCGGESPLYVIQYGAWSFLDFAKGVIDAASEVGIDFFDYAEPDYYPDKDNGYGEYIRRAYYDAFGEELPHPSTLKHRNFMEDYNLHGLKELSDYIHGKNLADHLTASPVGHSPYAICQNYGKYSNTPITELSNTYHHSFGRGMQEMLYGRLGRRYSPYRISGVECVAVRSMGDWRQRGGTYLGCGSHYPPESYGFAIDEQLFLHNTDIFFWEYPAIRDGGYGQEESGFDQKKKWQALQAILSERFAGYQRLPEEYHRAIPSPEVLLVYSKRGEYISPGMTWSAFFDLSLKLQESNIPYGVLYPERLKVLEEPYCKASMVVIDQSQPISTECWNMLMSWMKRGKVVLYAGNPGYDWDGNKLGRFPGQFRELFGIRQGEGTEKTDGASSRLSLGLHGEYKPVAIHALDGTEVIFRRNCTPLITLKGTDGNGYAAYSAIPLASLHGPDFSRLCRYLLSIVAGRQLAVEAAIEVEICAYENGKATFIAARNHCGETGIVKFSLRGVRPDGIEECVDGRRIPFHADGENLQFQDIFAPYRVKIYCLKGI